MAEQKFNDDLLLSERDQRLAYQSYPWVAHTLDFPELRKLFQEYDRSANAAKARLRATGKTAIVLGVCSLLGASAEPLYEKLDERWLSIIGLVLAACGILSVIIGAFGVLSEESKRQWLSGRLMTERLRQFQFQMLVRRAPSVFAAMVGLQEKIRPIQDPLQDGVRITVEPAAVEEFRERRLSWMSAFRLQYEAHLSSKLAEALEDELGEDFWLHSDEGLPDFKNSHTSEFFACYRALRIDHQIQYANYKLANGGFSSIQKQILILTQMSIGSILIVFILHILIALSLISFAGPWKHFADAHWVHVLIVWTAICALTARALEEGLQPTREQERYRRYRSVLVRLRVRFDEVSDAEKFQVMREIERTVYSEMVAFLKTNDEARFVL